MPDLRERLQPGLRHRQRRELGRRARDHREDREEIFDAGVDVITTGNHVYRHREVYEYLDRERAGGAAGQLPARQPRARAHDRRVRRRRVAVVNLSGAVQLKVARSPFPEATRSSSASRDEADVIIVDFHAEVTSEKVAMGWHLDGKVAAVLGTHTHVPTADARVLPGGTAFISDVGHDRLAGGRDRRQARPGADVLRHTDAGSLRDRRGRRLGDGSAGRRSARRAGGVDRAGAAPGAGLTAASATSASGKNQTM